MNDYTPLSITTSKEHLLLLNKLKEINSILVRLDELIGTHDINCTIIQTHTLIHKLFNNTMPINDKKKILVDLEKLFNTDILNIESLKKVENIIEQLLNNSTVLKNKKQNLLHDLDLIVKDNICTIDITKAINILQTLLTPNNLNTDNKNLINQLGILFKKNKMVNILKKLLPKEIRLEYTDKIINHFGKLFNSDEPNNSNNVKEVIDILYKICNHPKILDIPDMCEMTDIEEIITNIESLFLIEQNLKTLPQEIFMLRNLVSMTASFNKITHVQPEIIKLKKLVILNLSFNKITTLPELPKNLESIDLTFNRLVEFPNTKTKNYNKLYIYLDNNNITIMPDNINYINIISINLSNNNITNISTDFTNLNILRNLHLSNNNIQIVPNSISKLQLLERLTLNNNPIKEISNEIIKIKNLKFINLRNTHIDPNIKLEGYYKCVDIIR